MRRAAVASFSPLLFDPVSRIIEIPRDERQSSSSVQLHRENDSSEAVTKPSNGEEIVYKRRKRFSEKTLYSISFLLIATVIGWAIVDARVRIARLESFVQYLYMKSM